MKAIMVPTDFSDTAENAAVYAINLAKQIGVSKIVLYNAYQVPFTGDPTMPVIQLFGFGEIQKVSTNGLDHFKTKLLSKINDGIEIETLGEFAILADGINDACQRTGADLIVMGITGGSGLDILVGSNTISVAESSMVPVIIVPASVKYKPVESIVLVCDLNNIGADTTFRAVKDLLDATHAKLHVLNICHNKHHAPATLNESLLPDKLLSDYNPQYHHIDSKDFSEATTEFVDAHHVDMIVTLPKKHGFFENIFRKDHTKQLAFHTHVPLMCVHEEAT